jgi:hypothetical protein
VQDFPEELQGGSQLEFEHDTYTVLEFEHSTYTVLWNRKHKLQIYYLSGRMHRHEPYMEYLRWLHQNSHLFLKPTYNEEHITHLPDFDNYSEILDEYDSIIWQGTQQPERATFQNYVV